MARIGSYPIDAVIQDKDAWIGTENTNRVTRQFTAKGIAEYIDTKNVGLVFVGATNLLPGKKGLVPAPLAGQEGMYLKGDLGGGWTTIPVYTLDVPTGTTNVNLINTDGAGAIINSFITLTGGTYLTSVHTSGSQITFNHDNTTRSDTTSAVSPAAGASVPLVASVTSNATGHITAIDVKTVTWPADSDTTYTIDVPNATTSINLAGSDGTNDPIAFTTVAGNNGMTISRTDANTLNFNSKWQINNVNQDGYVPKGTANANKFWATDANGNPGWTFQPSQDQTLTSTGTTNASTGIVLSQNGGTVIVKGDGSTISASSNNTTNVITLEAINRVNTTYTLPVAAGAANTAVINLTDNSSVVSSVTFNGTANKIAISETVGNNGDITIGMPDDVTVTGELTVSGTGQSSFGGQVTIPQTPSADTDAASKKYVDDLVSGGLTFRGTFNAATGEILSGVSSGSQLYNCPGGAGTRIAVAVGDYYIVATAGGSFYCSGATLDIGDSIIATAAANADASVVTGWSVVQSDEGVASFTNANGTFVSAGTVNSNATGAVTMGTIDLSATGTKNNTTFLRGDNTWAVPAYVSYSAMTTSTLGLGKIKYNFGSTPAAESQSTTAARTYGVTKNASDQLVVNVPWVNSSDVNSVTASGATTALSGLSSTPNTGSVVIGLDINGRASLGTPASDDELMIYDTSTAKNVKVLVSDLASYAGSAATNQVTYWTSANEIGGAAGFTFAGGAAGAITMGGNLTVSGNVDSINGNGYRLKNAANSANESGFIRSGLWKGNTDRDPALFAETGLGLRFYTGGSANESLTIDSSGNSTFAGDLGIGGSPSHPLDVKGADTNNATIARFYSNTGTRGSFVINNGTGVSPTAFIGTAGGSEQLSIGTNSTEAIRIDGSQNSTFAGHITLNGDGKAYKLNTTSYDDWQLSVDSNGFIIYNETDSRYDLIISGTGNATFAGTVTTTDVYGASSLRVAALGGILYLDSGSSSSTILRTNGTTTALTLDSSQNAIFAGNVGIGITPSASFSGVEVLQLGKGMTIFGNTNDDRATMASNLILNTGTAFEYVMDGLAGKFSIEDGNMSFGTAPSGIAGDVATITERFAIANTGAATFAGTISAVGASTFTLNDGIFIKAVNGTNNVAATNVWGYGLYEGASKLGEISLVRNGTSSQMYIGTTGANQVLRIGSANKVTALTIDASQKATFTGDVQAPGIYVGATNASFDFYNQGTSYFNGAVTVDAAFTQSGGADVSFSGDVGIGNTSPDYPLDVTKGDEIQARFVGSQTGHTQGAIVLSSGTADSPASRGQGVYRFNEGNDTTWYTGTAYQSADKYIWARQGSTTSIAPNTAQTTYALMTLDNAGKLGIGEIAPATLLSLKGAADTSIITLKCTKNDSSWSGERIGGINFFSEDGSGPGAGVRGSINYIATSSSGGSTAMTFKTGDNTERMQINNDGHLLFNLQNYTTEPTNKNFFIADSGSGASVTIGGHSGTHTAVLFRHNGATTPGSISITTNSTSYNTSSDYRLKEDIKDFNGLEKVSDIKVYDFKWKTDESRSYGVIAHELQEVLPQAVNGEKDAEEMQSVDYSKIVPLLVKSIQELKAEIELLKNK
jgi:hypothetical protein